MSESSPHCVAVCKTGRNGGKWAVRKVGEHEFAAFLESMGRNIARARRESGLTQEQASALSGIDYKRWQKIEMGHVNVTVRTLHCMAQALDLSLSEMLAGEKTTP
jgi:ribosome-binding protein aMBF1 (putative translation factor)